MHAQPCNLRHGWRCQVLTDTRVMSEGMRERLHAWCGCLGRWVGVHICVRVRSCWVCMCVHAHALFVYVFFCVHLCGCTRFPSRVVWAAWEGVLVLLCCSMPSRVILPCHACQACFFGWSYFDFRYTVRQVGRSADFGNVEFENEWVAVPHVCLVGVFSTFFLSFFPGAHAVDRLKHTAPPPVRALPCNAVAITPPPLFSR